MKKLFFLFLVLTGFVINRVNAQNVGIGTLSPDPSAMLDITDTAKGILIPRMTSLQKDAIAAPAQGLLVFVTSDSSFYYYKGGWKKMMDNKDGWNVSGNSVSPTSNNFIGTTNTEALLFRIGNHNAGQLQPGNLNVGFGLSTLDSFASGSYNTAIGSLAAPSIKVGNYNTAMGTASLYATSSANGNTGIGAYTLLANRTGQYNTAVGTFAGLNNLYGDHNTLIGASADVTDTAIINATAIGYGAKVSLSNSLVLGGTGGNAVNVGIGTTTPHAPLQFANTNGRKLVLYEDRVNDYSYYGFAIGLNMLRYQTTGDHVFYAGTSDTTSKELVRIKGNGNIGIGNSNPQQRLDVAGKATIKDSLGIGVSSPHAPLQFANVNGRKLVLYEDVANDNKYYGFAIGPAMLRYQTDHDHVFYVGVNDTTSTELMRLASNGNVGIGISSPQQKLHVAGKGIIRDSLGIGTNNPRQRLDVSGKATIKDSVGIGTNNPQQRLDVSGKATIKDSLGIGLASPNAPLQFASTAGRKIVLFENGANDNEYYGLAIDPSTLRFQTNNEFAFFVGNGNASSTELMRIKGNSGNVGIGTTAIDEKLTVNGAVKIADGGYTALTQNATTPVPNGGAGTIAFSNNHFFGWNGTQWKQLDN